MPRWRTMIEPADTSCPSPALTPSRWPTLSRPFFELEPAFLCAIRNPSSCSWPRGSVALPLPWRRVSPSRRPWSPSRPSGLPSSGAPGPLTPACRPAPGSRPCRRLARGSDSPASAWSPGFGPVDFAFVAAPRVLPSAGLPWRLSSGASSASAPPASRECLVGGRLALGLGRARHVAPSPVPVPERRPPVPHCDRQADVLHPQHRQLLTVALLGAMASLGPVLEDDNLLASILANNMRGDRRLCDCGRADVRQFAIGHEQHSIELDRVARVAGQSLNRQFRSEFDTVLLATRFRLLRTWVLQAAHQHACCSS